MTKFLFSGLNLAVTTAFDSQGQIDFSQFERNIERYIDAGIESFVLSSGTGMHVYLKEEESNTLIKAGLKRINGRAKVIVQTSALLAEDVIARTRFAAENGADGVMILPPFFEGPTDDEGILQFYQTVAEGGLPIIGYNVPQAVGVGISPSLLAKLCKIPNFLTVKDSSGDLAAQAELIRTGLPVMNGADPLTPYALFAGVQGVIWGGANFAPRSCVKMIKAAEDKNWQAVREIWHNLEAMMNLIWQGDYVQSVYAAAQMAGFDAGTPRRPLRALSQDKYAPLKEAMEPLLAYERLL